jgi:YVTN family beta-propeller protein
MKVEDRMKSPIIFARRLALATLIISLLFVPVLTRKSSVILAAQEIVPAGTLTELSIDDGQGNCAAGTGSSLNGRGFGWANKLTPTAYPATLRSVTVGFNRILVGQSVVQDALYRIVVYIDPENDGPSNGQQAAATVTGRIRGETDEFMTFNLITPLTITSGSFVVGAIDDFGFGSLPALLDIPGKSTPRGSESFVSFDSGLNWKTQATVFGTTANCEPNSPFTGAAGSWLIRATVESNPVDVPAITRIKDPAAVEPWGVAVNNAGSEALVTNYVSDNLTVIKTSDNTFQNIALGDGPGGTADGPYGVAVSANDARAYVTLFGSNTIPAKEFPTDYANVATSGRVIVLTKQANGTYAVTTSITVGKGPRFPAIATATVNATSLEKLYVPCGGANRVDVINTTTNTKIKEINVGVDPSSCTFAAANAKLYVTNSGDGTISVIDVKTDTKIKDIAIPATVPPAPGLPALPALQNPISATISALNNNLYVTYNGANGSPNGAVVEIDTCKDAFVRVVTDATTAGTAPGSAGASGIAAPGAALTRDNATGLTPNAGGGGGGPFGIAACRTGNPAALIFTNDGLGIIGVLDSRIDQVVTSPALALAACPKPRAVACGKSATSHFAYVACGQPDSSVLMITIPVLRENLPAVPTITSIEVGKKIFITGQGFVNGSRIEAVDPDTGVCLTFELAAKVSNNGRDLMQKPPFSDGRTIKSVLRGRNIFLRVINPDGSVQTFAVPASG